jgi:bifunctional oligoribonuclease and PAP phosphatase NrnA
MSGRMRRVNEAVKQVLSEAIPSLKDPRIGFVTVTTVETTTDLDHAKVWVSVFGGENQRKKTLEALDGAAGVLQGRIGKELGLRRTPRLEFVYDRAVEQGVRMTRLIDELAPPTETTMPSSDIDAVVEALRAGDRFVVTSHDNPDGDALGSLFATHLALSSLGKDSVMVLGGEQPLPGEFGFLRLEEQGLLRAAPDDVSDRVLVAVDCAQESRIVEPTLLGSSTTTLNIDHHHDNTRFGDVDLVVEDASSTAEVLADVFDGLGVTRTPEIAEALYTAVVTDTGRFQYSNTSPKALRLAADLVEDGADVGKVFVEVYESTPFPKLRLLARALEHATELAGGRVVVSELRREDFEAAGADEPYSEGVIDHLRAVDGAELVALVRERQGCAPARRKGSLRSHPDGVDVSVIARSFGGGGHRRAAGFSTDLTMDEITQHIVDAFTAADGDREP